MLIAGHLPRLVANVVSILSSDAVNRATTFVLYALVARYLGPHAFGQMALALALFYTFQVLASAGLKTLLTREVARDRGQAGELLANGSLVTVVTALVAIIILFLFVWIMGYDDDTSTTVLLVGLGLLPIAVSTVCEGIFQGLERMEYIAYANLPVNVLRITLGFAALSQGFGIESVILALMGSQVALTIVEWWLMARMVRPAFQAVSLAGAWRLIRGTTTFFGIDALIAVYSSLNIFLLSRFANEAEVGVYSAAIQLLSPIMLILQSVVLSIFPVMCRGMDSASESISVLVERLLTVLMAIVFPLVIGLYFLAEPVLLLLYGQKDFAQSSILLQYLVWSLIASALISVLGQLLMAANRERFTLGIVAVHAAGNLVIGALLISQLGALGAVIMVLLDKVAGAIEHYVFVRWLVARVRLVNVFWMPVAAGACMAVGIILATPVGPFVSLCVGGTVYLTVLAMLCIRYLGGPGAAQAVVLQAWRSYRYRTVLPS